MDVNKIKILNSVETKEITFPLGMNWDLYDREGAIIQEEANIIQEVIGEPTNYELARFSRRPITSSITNQVYEFNFFSASTLQWVNSYLTNFTENQVLYYSNPFKKSFFKLDLYDSPDPLTQKIYLTIILTTSQSVADIPTCEKYRFWTALNSTFEYTDCCGDIVTVNLNQGQTIEFCPTEPSTATYTYNFGLGDNVVNIPINGQDFPIITPSPFPIVYIFILNTTGSECFCPLTTNQGLNYLVKPKMDLDHIGDQKGYFIHWFQDKNLLNIEELYMKAKFFNASTGTYTVFTREPQSNYVGNENKLPNELFYYRLNFDYNDFYYWFSAVNDINEIQKVEWYEYLNPNT